MIPEWSQLQKSELQTLIMYIIIFRSYMQNTTSLISNNRVHSSITLHNASPSMAQCMQIFSHIAQSWHLLPSISLRISESSKLHIDTNNAWHSLTLRINFCSIIIKAMSFYECIIFWFFCVENSIVLDVYFLLFSQDNRFVIFVYLFTS